MAASQTTRPVFRRFTLALMVGGALWITFVAIRIETQNATAGYYLPRHDEPGKWRMSRENMPRDQSRTLVSTVGLCQYLLAPLLMALAAVHITRRDMPWQRWRVSAVLSSRW
jgi:hypothetical protein